MNGANDHEFVGPNQKSRFRVLRSEGDGAGPVELEFVDDPKNPGPHKHWHPFAEELFVVLEGQLLLTVGDEQVILRAGEQKLIPRGVPHTFKNADPEKRVRFRSTNTPGRHFERLLGSMYDLDFDGKTDEVGMPKVLPLMALLDAHADVTLIHGPPRVAQRALAKVLGSVARMLGHPPVYRSERRGGGEGRS